jgi:hypothetical protein
MSLRFLKALLRLGQGTVEAMWGLGRRDPPSVVAGLQRAMNATGMAAGVLGFRYAEYRRHANNPTPPSPTTTSMGES